jgi:hypothetical protein
MKQWSLPQSDATALSGTGTDLAFPSSRFSLTLSYEGTSSEFLSDSFRKRIEMVLLLTQIPEEALDELRDTMFEIFEYYLAKANYVPLASSQPQERPMRYGGTQVRPIFTLGEDEE